MDRDRLNEAKFGLHTDESRDRRSGRREDNKDVKDDDEESKYNGSDLDYMSSSVASSFNYGALTDEEKARIIGGAPPPFMG